MDSNVDPQLVSALVSLGARADALTWSAGALLLSHPNPAAVLAAWQARQPDAADSGFEIESPALRETSCRTAALDEHVGS